MTWAMDHCQYRAKIIYRAWRRHTKEPGSFFVQYANNKAWLVRFLERRASTGDVVGAIEEKTNG